MFSADCYFQASKQAKSEDIAQYFAGLTGVCQEKGFDKVEIFLDRNTTHKTKMQKRFYELIGNSPVKVNFRLMAAYSPKLNLVEYAIHLIRQKVLHHSDCKHSLTQFENFIKELCNNQKVVSKQQIINILTHIESLVPDL